MARGFAFVLLLLPICLSACGGGEGSASSEIQVEGAWARPMPAGGNSAVYLVLENRGELQDRLVGAETPAAASVEIHESRMEGELMTMREVGEASLPGGGRVELAPGGMHLMLLGLTRALAAGDTLSLNLRFQETGSLALRVPVRRTEEG